MRAMQEPDGPAGPGRLARTRPPGGGARRARARRSAGRDRRTRRRRRGRDDGRRPGGAGGRGAAHRRAALQRRRGARHGRRHRLGRALRHGGGGARDAADTATGVLRALHRSARRRDRHRRHRRHRSGGRVHHTGERPGAVVHLQPDRQRRHPDRHLRDLRGLQRAARDLHGDLRAHGRAGALQRHRTDQRCDRRDDRRRDHRTRPRALRSARRAEPHRGVRRDPGRERGAVHLLHARADHRVVRGAGSLRLGRPEELEPVVADGGGVRRQATRGRRRRVRR